MDRVGVPTALIASKLAVAGLILALPAAFPLITRDPQSRTRASTILAAGLGVTYLAAALHNLAIASN